MNPYLPTEASIDEACEWLTERTGEQWTLPRLLDAGLKPWVWLDYSPDAPPDVFGDRYEGFMAPFVFWNDTRRLAIERQSALMTMTRNHEGKLMRMTPGLPVALSELRFKREDVMQLVATADPGDAHEPAPEREAGPTLGDRQSDADKELADLFDPVGKAQLEAMFPDGGKWKAHAEHAKRNGLESAREGRGLFNPYLAARWWLGKRRPVGWTWERCLRKLTNNLPSRSLDSKHLLTGGFD